METLWDDSHKKNVKNSGYKIFGKKKSEEGTKGIELFIKESLKSSTIIDNSEPSDLECI